MRFFRFVIVGASNTAVDFVCYIVLTRFFLVYFLAANVLSYCIGMTWSFYWNKRWTFENRASSYGRQYAKFFLINSVALLLSQAILYIAVQHFQQSDMIGKIIAAIVAVFWSFTLHRVWTFQSSL